jgi:hypothetical protein
MYLPDPSSDSGGGDARIPKQLCSKSGEGGESMPNVSFLPAAGREPADGSEFSLVFAMRCEVQSAIRKICMLERSLVFIYVKRHEDAVIVSKKASSKCSKLVFSPQHAASHRPTFLLPNTTWNLYFPSHRESRLPRKPTGLFGALPTNRNGRPGSGRRW